MSIVVDVRHPSFHVCELCMMVAPETFVKLGSRNSVATRERWLQRLYSRVDKAARLL